MRILTKKYENFSEVSPALRAFLEALAAGFKIDDIVDCVFIGKVSDYKKLKATKSGETVQELTYADAFVIIVETSLRDARNFQMTAANAIGLSNGIDSPEKLSMSCFVTIFKKIQQKKSEECANEE